MTPDPAFKIFYNGFIFQFKLFLVHRNNAYLISNLLSELRLSQKNNFTAKFPPEDFIRNFKSDNMKIVLADFRRLNANSRRIHYYSFIHTMVK
jgi:hypothetical protein